MELEAACILVVFPVSQSKLVKIFKVANTLNLYLGTGKTATVKEVIRTLQSYNETTCSRAAQRLAPTSGPEAHT